MYRYQVRVRFYELDPYNHVNHTAYLGYFEAARVEALAAAGFGLDVMKEEGFQIVLVEVTARFVKPATLHDDLVIDTEVVEIARSTSRWRQEMRRGEDLIATLEVKAAFTDLDGRPVRAPAGFQQAFSASAAI
ncbi:MAG TPA: thioesterase family protein [Acidimicrobiia bacterium]|nr:thioesterase family protein [Acidimicrobiia bacterium]